MRELSCAAAMYEWSLCREDSSNGFGSTGRGRNEEGWGCALLGWCWWSAPQAFRNSVHHHHLIMPPLQQATPWIMPPSAWNSPWRQAWNTQRSSRSTPFLPQLVHLQPVKCMTRIASNHRNLITRLSKWVSERARPRKREGEGARESVVKPQRDHDESTPMMMHYNRCMSFVLRWIVIGELRSIQYQVWSRRKQLARTVLESASMLMFV